MPRVKNKLPNKPPEDQKKDQPEKEFEPAESIVMLLLTGMSDIGDIVGLMVSPIPVIGQTLLFMAKVFSFFVWGIVQIWLVMKGANKSGPSVSKLATKPTNWTKFLFTGGSVLDLAGLPFGQTISLGMTIYLANHPKVTGFAEKAALAAATGGTTAALEGAAAAGGATAMKAGAGEALKRAGRSAGKAAMRTGRDMAQEALGDLGVDQSQNNQDDRNLNEALGEEPDVFDKLGELTRKTPGAESGDFDDISAKERRRRRRAEFVDIAGINSDRDEEEKRAA